MLQDYKWGKNHIFLEIRAGLIAELKKLFSQFGVRRLPAVVPRYLSLYLQCVVLLRSRVGTPMAEEVQPQYTILTGWGKRSLISIY